MQLCGFAEHRLKMRSTLMSEQVLDFRVAKIWVVLDGRMSLSIHGGSPIQEHANKSWRQVDREHFFQT